MMQLYTSNKGQGQTHSVSLQKSMESKSRKKDTAIQCGYKGCEMLWVSIFHALPATASQ